MKDRRESKTKSEDYLGDQELKLRTVKRMEQAKTSNTLLKNGKSHAETPS